jgi:hypothetical protein
MHKWFGCPVHVAVFNDEKEEITRLSTAKRAGNSSLI